MWTTQEGEEQMTLEEDREEIMRRVQRLHISDVSIRDRCVRDTYACMHDLHVLTTDVMGALRFSIQNEDRRRGGIKLICNGHLDPSTYTMQEGVHTVTGRRLLITSMTCVASMRPQVYKPVCVYDVDTGL